MLEINLGGDGMSLLLLAASGYSLGGFLTLALNLFDNKID